MSAIMVPKAAASASCSGCAISGVPFHINNIYFQIRQNNKQAFLSGMAKDGTFLSL